MFLSLTICIFVGFCSIQLARWIIGSFRLSKLTSRSVLITGCDSGFGHSLALKCSAAGMPVFAGCLTPDGAKQLESEAKGFPGSLLTILLDVTNQNSVDSAVGAIKKSLKGKNLWAVVNNAGIAGTAAPDAWLTAQHYQEVLNVNTIGTIRVCQALQPLIKRSRGRVVNIASITSRIAPQNAGPYSVSKYAVEAYSDIIRKELKPFGVSVHILNPGFFKTHLTNPDNINRAWDKIWSNLSPEMKDQYGLEYLEESEDIERPMRTTANMRSLGKLLTWKTLDGLCAQQIDPVVDAYFHAVTSVWPQSRYYPGWDSKLFFRPLSLLITPVQDWILLTLEKLIVRMSR